MNVSLWKGSTSVWVAAVWVLGASGQEPPPPVSEAQTVMDLPTAQRIALEGNPSLRATAARIRQADARLAQVKATYWPTIGLGGYATRGYLSDRSVQQLEQPTAPFGEDAQARVEQVLEENAAQLARADRAAQAVVRADATKQLDGYPLLQDLQQAWFEASDQQAALYQNAYDAALGEFTPLKDVIDALGIDTDPTVDDEWTSYWLGARASWLLFDGFARRFGRSVARYGRLESKASQRDAQRMLLGGVARAYYQTQLARAEEAIAEADVEFNARLLEEARRRRQAGQVSLSTELNFEIRRNAAEIAMVNARRKTEGALVVLAALLGYPESAWPEDLALAPLREEVTEQIEPPPMDDLLAYAVAQRPDLAFARAALEQARSGVSLARSAYSPTLSVTGSYGGYNSDEFSLDEEDLGGSVGAVLSFNLFEGGSRKARVREAAARESEAEAALAQAELTAASEVRSAVLTVRFAGELLELQHQNLSIVQKTRDLIELEFKANQASLVRLNEAQRDLVLAQSRYATSLASLHVAWHGLLEATSESLEAFDL